MLVLEPRVETGDLPNSLPHSLQLAESVAAAHPGSPRIRPIHCDLTCLKSVGTAVGEVLGTGLPLNVLLLNAGWCGLEVGRS